MKKYYVARGSLFSINEEQGTCEYVEGTWPRFDDFYLIEEDGTIRGKEVKAGDIVLTFQAYRRDEAVDFIVVKQDDELYQLLLSRLENEKENNPKDNCGACPCDECPGA